MSKLDTNLSRKPYFDDFDANSNHYQVLYRPGVAVQARELNTQQSMVQDQIDKFGRHIFKEGSVIEGCEFTFENNYTYVKIKDNYANGTAFTIADFQGQYLYNTNGLKAEIINTNAGFESAEPDLNTLYIRYRNSYTYSNGQVEKAFSNGQNIQVMTSGNVAIGNVTVATVANSTGAGYAFTTTEGVIYKKGFFIRVEPQTLIVSKYNKNPDNISVGFAVEETIVTPEANSALLDNAAGSPNYAAPGAHRLKLNPVLVSRPTDEIANTATFYSICDFKNGVPVTIKNDPQYNLLGKDMARRTYETNGNFVIQPFRVSAINKANSADPLYANNLNLVISKGLGYVEGNRVEYLNNNTVNLRRGVDVAAVDPQIVSLNFGNYINVKEVAGNFGDSSSIIAIDLHNTTKTAVTSRTFTSTAWSSTTKIGKAYVRAFTYTGGGDVGGPAATYRLYLFDIQMSAGKNFNDVRSAIYPNGAGTYGVADVVLTLGSAVLQNSSLGNLIFPFGQRAIKSDSFADAQFIYRKTSTVQVQTDGTANIAIASSGAGTGTEGWPYTGTLSQSQINDFIVIPAATGYSNTKTGTVTIYNTNNAVAGSGTAFTTEFAVGDYLYANSEIRYITAIANNTFLNVDAVFTANGTGKAIKKAFPQGSPIPFSNRSARSINISGNTATITLGEVMTSAFNISVDHNVERTATVASKKILNPSVYVKIDLANNAAGALGPWSLGLPDVYSVEEVYVGSSPSYTSTGTNYAENFTIDNGMKDSYYDLSYLVPKASFAASQLDATKSLLVKVKTFTRDNSQGVGFFTANSYPIDDVNGSANSQAIITAQIPVYNGTDLRDAVDFRPYSTNTAAVSTTIAGATVNPGTTLAFNASPPYIPAPDTQFQTYLEYYLPRTDRLVINVNGVAEVLEGKSDIRAQTIPIEKPGTMSIAIIKIPPYPSLSTADARTYNRYDYAVQSNLTQNRRYTMKDISALDKRITNIEYYTSLSLLEQSAATMTVRATDTGQTRYQNGIFVEPMTGPELVDNRYKGQCSITRSEKMRPAFVQWMNDFHFDETRSTNIVKHGELVMLSHTSNNLIQSQKYASRYRNVTEGNIYIYSGKVFLTPTATQPDITAGADVNSNIDLASNWTALKNAWGTQWGNWEKKGDTTYTDTLITSSSTTSNRVDNSTTSNSSKYLNK